MVTNDQLAAVFLQRARATGTGFAAVIAAKEDGVCAEVALGGGPALACAKDDVAQLEMLVSASIGPQETVDSLLSTYLRDPEGFVPGRQTEGSFLIVDHARRRVCFGRDRSAAQHLYTVMQGGRLYVGTELKPFLGTVCQGFDPIGVAMFLSAGLHIAPFPLYRGLGVVLPGHWHSCRVTSKGLILDAPRVFWRVERVGVPGDYRDAMRQYADLLMDRIHHAVRGGGAGIYLSGGSDSATVAGALARVGAQPFVAAHMHVPGHHDNLELGLVLQLERALGFQLEIVRPRDLGEDRIAFIGESCRAHVGGSYPTYPGYRLCARAFADLLPASSVVFNGELCLLDVGFSTANERNFRHLRRWLYRGGGRVLARLGPVIPRTVQRAALASEPRRDKGSKIWCALLDIATSLGRPELFFAGLKLGFRGFPGLSRFSWDIVPPEMRLEWLRRVNEFFHPYLRQLQSDEYSMAFATLTIAWYSEASNLTMASDALDRSRLTLCFPFNSAALMDFSASLPERWARDKRIQKDMSREVLNLPLEVSHVQKDHSRGRPYFEIAFSDLERQHFLKRVSQRHFGVFQPFADLVLLELPQKWSRWHDVFSLYWLSEMEDFLQDARCDLSSRAAASIGDRKQ